MFVRRWLWLGLLVALSGCNTVHSPKPLFRAEDVDSAEPLRPGLWLLHNVLDGVLDDDCRFNPGKPLRKWPACAHWMLVREADVLQLDRGGAEDRWQSAIYVLAAGQPRVLQVTARFWSADAGAQGAEQSDYSGLAPTAHDEAGRITAYRAWDAQCGPRDHTAYPENSGSHPTTLEPLPGLVMDENGQSCAAKDQAAVRRSVDASESWDVDHLEARWVRDPRPDDFGRR